MKISGLEKITEDSVNLVGRIVNVRQHRKNLYFLQLEDHTGQVQCVVEDPKYEIPSKQSIVRIEGKLIQNPLVRSGIAGKEIQIEKLSSVSPCYETPRFDPSNIPNSRKLGLENRHIMLRNPKIREIFEKKSHILRDVRNYFADMKFTEVESPGIVGNNVEGPVSAFQVDYFGKNAYMTISNMLYHHILISGGFEKIFEVGKLYRQDKLNSSLLLNEILILEYTLANKSREEVMDLTEGLLKSVVINMNNRNESPAVSFPDKIPVITYRDLTGYLNKCGHSVEWGQSHTLGRSYTKDLKSKFESFFWLIDQPAESKSFFTASREDEHGKRICNDFQLWHPDYSDICDGSERVIDYKVAVNNLISKGLNPENYGPYLSSLSNGIYPCTGVGLGLNKLAMVLLGCENVRDVVLFPRDQRTMSP